MIKQYENFKYDIQDNFIIITGITENHFSDIKIPEKINNLPVKKIGFRAFAEHNNNSKLKNVELPYGLTEIAAGAFASCTAIEKIIIPPTTERIEESAFYNCISLKEIEIPDTIIYISDTAFEKCQLLQGITLAYYKNSSKSFTFLPEISQSISKSQKTELIKKEFVFIPKENDNFYSSYLKILCKKNFSWHKYDSLFSFNINTTDNIYICVSRLISNTDLSVSSHLLYEGFLKFNSARFLEYYSKTDNLNMLIKFGTLGLITAENINDCIQNARKTKSNNALLYLISYKYKKIQTDKEE